MNNKKPIIGISANIIPHENKCIGNFLISSVANDYVVSILKAGGVPTVLPIIDDIEAIARQIESVDAVVLTGGDADINPSLYGEIVLPKCSPINNERDLFDLELAKALVKKKKPTLFICRGHQLNNVMHGGTLHQDISYANGIHLTHLQHSAPNYLAHEVIIEKDTLLYDILKKDKIWINSFHHQIINSVAKTLKVSARATDGAIEAVEYKNPDYFSLSLQWHPEMLAVHDDEDMLKIFKRLIKEAKILEF